jgi:cytochrome P450
VQLPQGLGAERDLLAAPGQSMLESVIALATLVRDFQFAAPPGEPARTNHITLRPTHGVPSRVTVR